MTELIIGDLTLMLYVDAVDSPTETETADEGVQRETGKGGREKQHNIIYIHGLLTVRHLRLLFIEWQSVQGIYIVSYHIHI